MGMKSLCCLLVLIAFSSGEDCQVYKDALQKFTHDMAARQSRPLSLLDPDGVCEDGEGWSCSLEIGSTVLECIAGFGTGNPLGIYGCVMDAIGAVNDCVDCVCWVMSFL